MAVSASAIAGGGVFGPLAAVATAIAPAFDFKFPLGVGGRDRPPDQDERVSGLLEATNAMLRAVEAQAGKLVLLIDGLDRVRAPETVTALFVESAVLGRLACDATVLTGPLTLRREGIAQSVRVFRPYVLANAPVLLRSDPARDGSGIAFLEDVYLRRAAYATLDGSGLNGESLRRLARASGGRVREFAHLIRAVAEQAWDADIPTATDSMVEAAIDTRRRVCTRCQRR